MGFAYWRLTSSYRVDVLCAIGYHFRDISLLKQRNRIMMDAQKKQWDRLLTSCRWTRSGVVHGTMPVQCVQVREDIDGNSTDPGRSIGIHKRCCMNQGSHARGWQKSGKCVRKGHGFLSSCSFSFPSLPFLLLVQK